MRAGQLRHVVDIERPVETQSTLGEVTPDWTAPVVVLSRIRAAIEPLRARERFTAAQIQSDTDTVIRLRFVQGINEKMRVKHEADGVTSYYEIQGLIHVNEMRRELQLLCVKRGAEGFRSG